MDYEPSPLTSEVQNQVYTKGRQSGNDKKRKEVEVRMVRKERYK